jgi:trigger factor
LKIETQILDDHQAKLTVEVDPEPLQAAKQRAARQISKQTKIPGFRPGKAPYHMVVRTVGEAAIMEEALELLVNELYPKIIEESGIKPYGPGKLENMPSTDPPTFEFIVPLDAEVTLGDYHVIRLPYELAPVPEANVDHVIEDLRSRHAIIEPVERPAQEGDQVYIRLSGERKQVDEGQDPILVKDRPIPVVIDNESNIKSDEWPFAGFSRHLIGLSSGEEKDITYTYPDDCQWESLRGKEADFQITVESVKSRQVPELNDEFAQSVGKEYQSMDTLRTEIRSSLEQQAKEEYDTEFNEKIIDALLPITTFKYPPQMLENEIDVFLDQLNSRISQQGMDIETYLKTRQMSMEDLRNEVKPLAEKRLKQTLALFEVGKAENIQVPNEEIESESSRALGELSQYLPREQAKKTITDDFVRNMIGNISADLLVKRTYECLQTIAKGEYQPKVEESTIAETTQIETADQEVEPKSIQNEINDNKAEQTQD